MSMLKIALVGCVKEKRDVPTPAWDLYTSPMYRGSFDEAVLRCGRERTWIISAEHGLVDLDTVLAPYDLALGDVPTEKRRLWGERVMAELLKHVPASACVEVHAFAGEAYLGALRPLLPAGWVLVDALDGELGQRLSQLSRLTERREAPAPVESGAFSEAPRAELRLLAMEVEQLPGRFIYSFAVEGKALSRFSTVSRMRRLPGGPLFGYQRPTSRAHVRNIRAYLESARPMMPGAPVLALGQRVRFEPLPGQDTLGARHGHIIIPLPGEDVPEEDMPVFIVDGQQRISALAQAQVEGFRVVVTAFFSESVEEQATQFILGNNVVPIPRSHVYELLPHTTARLPPELEALRLPTLLVERLNLDTASPLCGLVASATNPDGLLKEASLLRAIRSSLASGALRPLLGLESGTPDVRGMLSLLFSWWGAVRDVFPEDWGLPPEESRLFHGAGVAALGALMDAVCTRRGDLALLPTRAQLAGELRRVAPACRWRSGTWDFRDEGERAWNKVQNTGQDIQLLTAHLLLLYREQRPRSRRTSRKQAA